MPEIPTRKVESSKALLSIAYFPPVEYFSIIGKFSSVSSEVGPSVCGAAIDGTENYQKQSYRNRCRILTANGPEDLRFPIVHDGIRKITEVRVDYSTPWISKTKTAIDSSYYSSPFFEYYRDELYAVMDARPDTLWELDHSVIRFFCMKIGLPVPEAASGVKDGGYSPQLNDYRDRIHPKREPVFRNREYWQVFREKYGFVPNLSIMDLLFNEGPESISYLDCR